ncbi:MAG TPA: GDP-mannose 4,6-dehydratase [Candidatus Hydrogenedentes bacterium]|nr:GDP-mannose 4,6-dehydratase [Candidatus Hydrogenedentota bacterium]
MTRRALITGGAGFAGRVLHDYLTRQGWETVRCDCMASPGVLSCDITDANQVDAVFQQAGGITHVFHLAAIAFVPTANRDPAAAMNVNLIGAIRIAEAMRQHAPAARLLSIASAEVYGRPISLPITETHPLNPVNPYAISKAAADFYCAYLHEGHKVDVVRVRPFNHAGPGQSDQFVLSSFARQIAEIEAGQRTPVVKVGNLRAARDFLHVNDVVRAYELIALRGHSGEAYNICSGAARTIQDALNLLIQMSPKSIVVEEDPERFRPVDVPEVTGSHAKLTEHTGWTPQIPFEEILSDILNAWRKHFRG